MTREFDDESQDSVGEQLDQLIAEAGQHPEKSRERKKCLRLILNSVLLRGQLFDQVIEEPDLRRRRRKKQLFIWVMQESGGIWMPRWIAEYISEEDRADLLSETWSWFCSSFEQYVPERAGPVTMFNYKLKKKAIDLYNEVRERAAKTVSIDQPISGNDDETLTIGDKLPSPDPDSYSLADDKVLRERVKACLDQNVFIRKSVSQCPDIHCRLLLSNFLLDQMEWEEIFQQLGVLQNNKLQARIRQCYRRKCLPCLQEHLKAE